MRKVQCPFCGGHCTFYCPLTRLIAHHRGWGSATSRRGLSLLCQELVRSSMKSKCPLRLFLVFVGKNRRNSPCIVVKSQIINFQSVNKCSKTTKSREKFVGRGVRHLLQINKKVYFCSRKPLTIQSSISKTLTCPTQLPFSPLRAK